MNKNFYIDELRKKVESLEKRLEVLEKILLGDNKQMEHGELSLIRTLMNKDFYDNNKGIHTPDKLFTKDVRRIKQTVDYAMEQFNKDLTFAELEGLFFTRETLTTANKDAYKTVFDKLRTASDTQGETRDVAQKISYRMGKLFPVSWKALMDTMEEI